MRQYLFTLMLFLLPTTGFSADTVYKLTVDRSVNEVYDKIYAGLESAKFFVVFEPNVGKNIAGFAKRWGDDYNQNKLSAIRAMVFCNAWYVNQVSNNDPDMLGLCPLHLTVIGRDGKTSILFNRPSVIAEGSPAYTIIKQVENEVIAAIENSLH